MPATMSRTAILSAKTAEIKALLTESRRAVEKALLVLLDRQTEDEQRAEATHEHNGMGFTSYDAELLTSFAKQVKENRYQRALGQRLSERQFEIAKKRVMKYAKRLATVALDREARETVAVMQGVSVRQMLREAEAETMGIAPSEESAEFVARWDRAVAAAVPVQLGLLCPTCGGSQREDVYIMGELAEIGCRQCGPRRGE
jgi:hypothetical protein